MRESELKLGLWSTILAIGLAGAAALLMLIGLNSRMLVGGTMVAGVLGVAALVLSGNPRLFCLWGLVLAAPLELSKRFVIKPHMGGESAFRIELVDFFIFALLFFILRDVARGARHGLRLPGFLIWWGMLAGLGVLTIALGPLRTPPAHEVFRMIKVALLIIVVANEVVRAQQFRHVAAALLAGVALESCLALVQYAFGARLGLEALGEADQKTLEALAEATLRAGEKVHRVGGLIGHANLLAAYLALLLPLGIALLFCKLRAHWKFLCAAAVLLGEAALIVTLSRSGWISFVAAGASVIILSCFHARMRRRYVVARIGIVVASVLIGAILFAPISTRLFKSDPGAVEVRIEWLGTAWKMIQTRPILGFGLNTYVFEQAPYTKEGSNEGLYERYGEYWPVVHNVYAITWSEQGTVGFVIFLAMHAHFLYIGIRNLKVRDDFLFAVNAGSICGIGAIMIDGMASFFLREPDCARQFWISVGLVYAVHYWRRLNEQPEMPATPINLNGSRFATPHGP